VFQKISQKVAGRQRFIFILERLQLEKKVDKLALFAEYGNPTVDLTE